MAMPAVTVLRPDVFDGYRVDIVNGLGGSQAFAVTHNTMFGSSFFPSGRMYQFGATYQKGRTMMMGRLSPADGTVKAIAVTSLMQGLQLKANCDLNRAAAAQPIPSSATLDMQYTGADWSMQASASMVEGEDPTAKVNMLQSLTQNLCLGGEGSYDSNTATAKVAWGGRLIGADYMATATHSFSQDLQDHRVECHYLRKVDQFVSLATSLTCIPSRQVAQVAVGYDFNLERSRVQAALHSNWQLHATLEERIGPGFSLLFSGLLDHSKETYKFGMGVTFQAP